MECVKILKDFRKAVTAIATHDHILVAGSRDRSIKVWSIHVISYWTLPIAVYSSQFIFISDRHGIVYTLSMRVAFHRTLQIVDEKLFCSFQGRSSVKIWDLKVNMISQRKKKTALTEPKKNFTHIDTVIADGKVESMLVKDLGAYEKPELSGFFFFPGLVWCQCQSVHH